MEEEIKKSLIKILLSSAAIGMLTPAAAFFPVLGGVLVMGVAMKVGGRFVKDHDVGAGMSVLGFYFCLAAAFGFAGGFSLNYLATSFVPGLH